MSEVAQSQQSEKQTANVSMLLGNRCGHDKANPHCVGAYNPYEKPLPKQVLEIFASTERYFFEPKIMPVLCYQSKSVNQDGMPRLCRTELREGQGTMLKAMFGYTDWASLRIGIPLDDGSFRARSHVEIAQAMDIIADKKGQYTKVSGKPNKRYYKTLRSLIRAGALKTHRVYKKVMTATGDIEYKARTGIKALNKHFIIALTGMSYKRFKKFRDDISVKAKNKKLARRYNSDGKTLKSDRDSALKNLKSSINVQKIQKTIEAAKRKTPTSQSYKGYERPRKQEPPETDMLSANRNQYILKAVAEANRANIKVDHVAIRQAAKEKYPDK